MENHNFSSYPSHTKFASFGLRFIAYWIDYLFVFIITLVAGYAVGYDSLASLKAQSLAELEKVDSSQSYFLSIIIGVILTFLYYVLFWVYQEGATPGKKIVGIKIVGENNSPISFPRAMIRFISFFIVSIISVFTFGLGFFWVVWDKKKQAWHDKLSKTLVVKTDKQPHIVIGIFLMIISLSSILGYMGLGVYNSLVLAMNDLQKGNKQSSNPPILYTPEKEDKSQIISYAPSNCGVSVPIPKTKDTYQKKQRKWIYEELPLDTSMYYVLDKDVFTIKEAKGAFLGYKTITSRLEGENFSIVYPGINIYCIENTKFLTLEEYRDLALTNKNYTVTAEKKGLFGELDVIPVILNGKNTDGTEFNEPAYLGLTKDKKKLLYIRIWAVEESDPLKRTLDEDIDLIIRNLKYRGGEETPRSSGSQVNVEKTVKGISTTVRRDKKN